MSKIITISLTPFSKFWQIPFYNQFGFAPPQAEPVSKYIILISENIFGATCLSIKNMGIFQIEKKNPENTSR
jgi:hypothetical protein